MFKHHVKFYLLTISFSLSIASFSFAMQGEEEKKGANIRVSSRIGGHTEGKDNATVVSGDANTTKVYHINLSGDQNEVKEEKNGIHVFSPDVIKIVSAKYGAPGWLSNGFHKVEPYVVPYFDDKRSGSILVSNDILGGDPSKGHSKTLEVFYQCMRGGQASKMMRSKTKENELLHLTCIDNKEKKF